MRISGLVVQIAADITKMRAGLAQATAGVRAFQQNVEGVAGGISKQFDAVAQSIKGISPELAETSRTAGAVVAGLAAALGGAAIASVRAAAAAEQTAVAYERLVGSAEEAARLLQQINRFADVTPFSNTEVQEAGRQLLGLGFQAQQVIPMLTAVGDAASGMGRGAQGMDTIIRALGKISASSKVTGEAIAMIGDMGYNAWKPLAETLGVSIPEAQKRVSAGAVDASTGIRALLMGMATDFSGMMDAQSKTLSGLFSTMQGVGASAMARMGQDIADALDLSGVADSAIASLNKIKEWAEGGGFARVLQEIQKNVGLLAGAFAGMLAPAILKAAVALRVGMLIPMAKFIAVGAVLGTSLQSMGVQFGSWQSAIVITGRSLAVFGQVLAGIVQTAAGVVSALAQVAVAKYTLARTIGSVMEAMAKASTMDFTGARRALAEIGGQWESFLWSASINTGGLFADGIQNLISGFSSGFDLLQDLTRQGMNGAANAITAAGGAAALSLDDLLRMFQDMTFGATVEVTGAGQAVDQLKAVQEMLQALDASRQLGQMGIEQYTSALRDMAAGLAQTLSRQTPLTAAWTETAETLLRVQEAMAKVQPEALSRGLELLTARYEAGHLSASAYATALQDLRTQAAALVESSRVEASGLGADAFLQSMEVMEKTLTSTFQLAGGQIDLLSAQISAGVIDLDAYAEGMRAIEQELLALQQVLPATSAAWVQVQRTIEGIRRDAKRPVFERMQQQMETLSLSLQLGGISVDHYKTSLSEMLLQMEAQLPLLELGTEAWTEMARAILRVREQIEQLDPAKVKDFMTELDRARQAAEGLATALLAIDTTQLLASLGRVADEVGQIASQIPGGVKVAAIAKILGTSFKIGQAVVDYLRSNAREVQKEYQDLSKSLSMVLLTSDIATITRRKRGGFAGMLGVQQYALEINELALGIARALDQGVMSAIQSSIKGILTGSDTWLDDLQTGIRDAISAAITEAVLQGALIKGAFGTLLNELTQQLTQGQMGAAALTIERIAQMVPSLAAVLQDILSPLRGAMASLSGSAADASRGIAAMTAQLTNVPSGMRVALARFEASIPEPAAAGSGTVEIHFSGPVYGTPDLETRIRTAITTAQREESLARYGSPVATYP
jgi:tape measure domain-containing protein